MPVQLAHPPADMSGENRLSGHAGFAVVGAPAGRQQLRRTVHLHAEGAVAVRQGVSEHRGTALRAGGIS